MKFQIVNASEFKGLISFLKIVDPTKPQIHGIELRIEDNLTARRDLPDFEQCSTHNCGYHPELFDLDGLDYCEECYHDILGSGYEKE